MAKKYLPKFHKTIIETIKGKRIQKWVYPDDSYGIYEDDKVTRYFPDKKIETYVKESEKEFEDASFVLIKEKLPDGSETRWYRDGRLSFEKLADGTIRSYYENGQLEIEKLTDGTEREFYADGKMSRAKLPDGTIMEWEHYKKSFGIGGNIKNEKINNIVMREWHENGQLAYAKSPNGIEIRYDKFGRVIYHAIRGIDDTEKYLEKRRKAKRKAFMREKLGMEYSSERQLAICEKLRQKALEKYEEALLASKLESDNEKDLKIQETQEIPNNNITETVPESESEKHIDISNNTEKINDTIIKKEDTTDKETSRFSTFEEEIESK